MDSILADAGRPAGVVHRIGDLLSVFLETARHHLMTPLKLRVVVGKGEELPFQVSSGVPRADPSGLTKNNSSPTRKLGAQSPLFTLHRLPRSEPFDFRIPCFQLFQRRLDFPDGRIRDVTVLHPVCPCSADERLQKFFLDRPSNVRKGFTAALEIPGVLKGTRILRDGPGP